MHMNHRIPGLQLMNYICKIFVTSNAYLSRRVFMTFFIRRGYSK